MFFASRMQAGRMLATKLDDKYRYENCAVVALDDAGVAVGAQIAMKLHCAIYLLNNTKDKLPTGKVATAGIADSEQSGINANYRHSDIGAILSDHRSYAQQEKLRQMLEHNHLVSNVGVIDKGLLKGQNIILVSEGFKSAFEIELAYAFLKPIAFHRLIFTVPFASVAAIDRMHILGDEICCLDAIDKIEDINTYYDQNDVPSHDKILEIIKHIVLGWK